jgi:hypothetical protein
MSQRRNRILEALLLFSAILLVPQPAYATGPDLGPLLFLAAAGVVFAVYLLTSIGYFVHSRFQPAAKRKDPGAGTRIATAFYITLGCILAVYIYSEVSGYIRGAWDLQEMEEKALHGDIDAQKELGFKYSIGIGVRQNPEIEAKWYRMAAEQGDVGAQFAIASDYRTGKGVPKDLAEASKWMRLSAEQGWKYAQEGLGEMYWLGEGLPQDFGEASFWFALSEKAFAAAADEQHASRALHERDDAEAHLSPQQVDSLNRRIMEWKAKPTKVSR